MHYSHKVSVSEETKVQYLEPVHFISRLIPIESQWETWLELVGIDTTDKTVA